MHAAVQGELQLRTARHLLDQAESPEVHPVASVERDRKAMADMQRGRAAPRARSVLDVVDDQRARVQQLHDRSEPRRARTSPARELEAQRDQLGSKSLARCE